MLFRSQGASYAIPTKDERLRSLPLDVIARHVADFLAYASAETEVFRVTAIGTGLAGYRHEDMAPMFAGAPANVLLPDEWKPIIAQLRRNISPTPA